MTGWTAADQAELDLLLHEVVTRYWDHRAWCAQRPCPHLRVALEALEEWRRRRELTSIAAFLRAWQDIDDWTTEAPASPDRREAA